MAASSNNPTDPMRLKASRYPGVAEGTACTQSSFKVGKQSFLFVGMQGGRYKAMFKLEKSIPQATQLAEADPDRFQVGNTAWVTARFTADEPMPKKLWEAWLDESYGLSLPAGAGKKPAVKKKVVKKTAKKAAKKKTVTKKAVKKRVAKR